MSYTLSVPNRIKDNNQGSVFGAGKFPLLEKPGS